MASASTGVALRQAAAIAVFAVLVLSSLRQPAMATFCSDCGSTCNNQVTTTCGGIKSSVGVSCMSACRGSFNECSSSCRNAADNSYNSCKSTVYQRCMDTCNANCTTNP